MQYIHGKQVKIITGVNAFDFETKLNAFLSDLNCSGTPYELQINPSTGLIAYVVFEEHRVIPETTADKYELSGETHYCLECPFYRAPTDGRFKHTVCGMDKHIRIGSKCCEWFYEELAADRIKLREVWHGK